MSYPRIIAHRGGGAVAPENSLAGLRLAARLGCRGVEFDTMLGADGIPVLVHDETLERTTCAQGRVAELDTAALVRLDVGARHHPAFAGEWLPTLEQALHLCAALDLWANVEIKPSAGQDAATGRAVARLAAAAQGRLVLSSFSAVALGAAAAAAPQLPRAVLVKELPTDWRERVAASGAMAVHGAAGEMNAAAAQAVRGGGFPLACYTVNHREDAERLFAIGVDSVFTDRPDLWQAAEM